MTSRSSTLSSTPHDFDEASRRSESNEDVKPHIAPSSSQTTLGRRRRSSTAAQSLVPSKRVATLERKASGRLSSASRRSSALLKPSVSYSVQELGGEDIPTLNGLFTRVVDTQSDGTTVMYIYGGTREYSATQSCLTNDFYRLDFTTMTWENLSSKTLEITNAHHPFAREFAVKELPPVEHAASAIYYSQAERAEGNEETPFMLVYGGAGPDGFSTNQLLSINLRTLFWERVQPTDKSGRPIDASPRSGASSFVIADRLFIFGGVRRSAGKKHKACDSFSVLDLKTCQWLVVDKPYPSSVMKLGERIGIFCPEALKGYKLLIMKGKVDEQDIAFDDPRAKPLWVFNTETYTFSEQISHGDAPSKLTWCDVTPHRGSDTEFAVYGNLNKPTKKGELPNEMWTFDMGTDTWTCKHIEKTVWGLDMDLQTLEYIPQMGWCLLGYREPTNQASSKARMAAKDDYDCRWNVSVRLDFEA